MALEDFLKIVFSSRLSKVVLTILILLVFWMLYHFRYSKEAENNTSNIEYFNIRGNVQVIKDEVYSLDGLANDNPKLIEIIKKHWIEHPSKEPYNFSNPSSVKTSMFEQDTFVDGLFYHMENGFFIEVGAVDGEAASNSFFFEMSRKWTGLLVEPDPYAYSLLKTKHRKAYSVNSCLDSHASQVLFDVMWRHGHIEKGNKTKKTLAHDYPHYKKKIQCFSLYSLLLAINQTRVDYFSLDVESAEPQVLRGIPFDKIDIRVICVEFIHCGKQILNDILVPLGYKMVKEMGFDLIYVKS